MRATAQVMQAAQLHRFLGGLSVVFDSMPIFPMALLCIMPCLPILVRAAGLSVIVLEVWRVIQLLGSRGRKVRVWATVGVLYFVRVL